MEAHPCLMRFLTNLARLCASISANGPRKNSFRPDSPLTTTFNWGRKTQKAPSHHTGPGPFRTRPHSHLNLRRPKKIGWNFSIKDKIIN